MNNFHRQSCRCVYFAYLAVTMVSACAHRQPVANVDSLRAACETYHRLVRWGDFTSAARMVVPERRAELLKRLVDENAEENLKITDYELQDVQLNQRRATLLSKITWHQLPSVTTRSQAAVMQWEERNGVWFIASIKGGPLPLSDRCMANEPPATSKPEADKASGEASDTTEVDNNAASGAKPRPGDATHRP